jgi:hypothetical protein
MTGKEWAMAGLEVADTGIILGEEGWFWVFPECYSAPENCKRQFECYQESSIN